MHTRLVAAGVATRALFPLLAAALLATTGAQAASASPSQPPKLGFAYGAFLAVPMEGAQAGNEREIRSELRKLKALHVNVVGQVFSVRSTVRDWRAFLDVARDEYMQVVPFFDIKESRSAVPRWTGNGFDLGATDGFLRAIDGHPAVYAVSLIDEPFHRKHGFQVTTERMQMLYRQAKKLAPKTRLLVGWSREVWRAERGEYGPDYRFRKGMCDVCMISSLEFRDYGQGPFFDRKTLIQNHVTSRRVIRREAPNAEIWTTVQVFGTPTGRNYVMPTVEQLREMIDLLLSPQLQSAGKLEGMAFQRWKAEHPEQTRSGALSLSDPQFAEHRAVVKAMWARVKPR